MRLLLSTVVASLALLVGSPLLACGGHSEEPSAPTEQSTPQSQGVGGTPLVINSKGGLGDLLKYGGAGLGGALVAGSIAWSMRRHQA